MRISKAALFLLISISLCLLFSLAASANSAEAPSLTVIVINPPADLSLSLQVDDTSTEPIILRPEKKAWERYYRFFHSYLCGQGSIEGATLLINYNNESFQCELPRDLFKYNNIVTLDIAEQAIISGQPAWRMPVLVAMRVILTLLIEGLIFFLFGFRNKKSWIAFFIINLITQGTLNVLLTGPRTGLYWLFDYIVMEQLVFAAEMISFPCVLKEYSKERAIFYAFTANAASLLLGGALISFLPI